MAQNRKNEYGGTDLAPSQAKEVYDDWGDRGRPTGRGDKLNKPKRKQTMSQIEEVTKYPDKDPEKTLATIDKLAEQEDKSYINNFLTIFDITTDPAIRNNLALILSDWRVSEIVPKIIQFIKFGPKDQIGTLIYALSPFEYNLYLNDVLYVLKTENFEAKEMVIKLLENLPESIEDAALLEATRILKDLNSGTLDPDNEKYINYALELLNEYN